MPEAEGAPPSPEPSAKPKRRRKFKWRAWLRALHRDFGYLAVGLTFIYALSGLAVNHIADWDPSFENFEREYSVTGLVGNDDAADAATVLAQAGIDETPEDIYRVTDELLEITLPERTLHVTISDGAVFEEGRTARPFLRVANWLHLNRGKKAWVWFADGYAIVLVFLATSGMFMIAGKKGLLGRGCALGGHRRAVAGDLPLGDGLPVGTAVARALSGALSLLRGHQDTSPRLDARGRRDRTVGHRLPWQGQPVAARAVLACAEQRGRARGRLAADPKCFGDRWRGRDRAADLSDAAAASPRSLRAPRRLQRARARRFPRTPPTAALKPSRT